MESPQETLTTLCYLNKRITLLGDTALVGATNRWVRVVGGVETVGMFT
jgi:hypothetical protein